MKEATALDYLPYLSVSLFCARRQHNRCADHACTDWCHQPEGES